LDAETAALLGEAEFPLLLQQGRRQMEEKKFAEAVLSLEAAVSRKPKDPQAQKALEEARKKKADQDEADYKRAMAEGDGAVEKKDWKAAVVAFTTALTKKPGDAEASSKRDKARSARDAVKAPVKKDLFPPLMKPDKVQPPAPAPDPSKKPGSKP
jgi:hypothetical protein